jgi:hypothetical protein
MRVWMISGSDTVSPENLKRSAPFPTTPRQMMPSADEIIIPRCHGRFLALGLLFRHDRHRRCQPRKALADGRFGRFVGVGDRRAVGLVADMHIRPP